MIKLETEYRSTGMGAFTKTHIWQLPSFTQMSATSSERSKTGNHGVDLFVLPKDREYLVITQDTSNSGKNWCLPRLFNTERPMSPQEKTFATTQCNDIFRDRGFQLQW